MDIVQIEKSVISSLIWTPSMEFMELTQGLTAEMFHYREHQWLFAAMQQMALDGRGHGDLMLLASEMERQGHPEVDTLYLINLTNDYPPVTDVCEYVNEVVDQYLRRCVSVILAKAAKDAVDITVPIAKTIAETYQALLSAGGLSAEDTITLTSILEQLRQRVIDNASGKRLDGFLTGFQRIDAYGGLHTKDLVIIAGLSSHGKTALALTMASNAARLSEARVLIFSMEMDAMQIGARLLAPRAQVPSNVILYRPLKERGQSDVDQGISRMQDMAERVFIGEGSVQSLEGILGSIRLHHSRYGVRLVIVDYLQILAIARNRDTSREQALADVARQLKNIAKELDICVLLLSQLNRDGVSTGNPEPSAWQIRGSGQVNEAADLTLLVYRPEVVGGQYRQPHDSISPKGTALLKVDKDRNGGYGGLGSFITTFNGPLTWFEER